MKITFVLPHWMRIYGYSDEDFLKKGHFSLDIASAVSKYVDNAELILFTDGRKKTLDYKGIKVKFFPLWKNKFFLHKWRHISFEALRYLIKLDKETIIYFHQPAVIFCDLVLFNKLFGRIKNPIVAHIHDLDIFSPFRYYKYWFWPAKCLLFKKINKFVIGNSIIEKNLRRYRIPEKKIKKIPYGICIDKYPKIDREEARRNLGFKENKIYFLFSGRLHPSKGLEMLVLVFEKMKKTNKDVKLIIVGPPMREEMKKIVKKYYWGYVSFEKLCNLYSACDVFVLPSNLEAWGLVLLEAIRYNTPVISTYCGGPEEFVTEEQGILIPKKDPKALENAMLKMLDLNFRKNKAKDGRIWVKENYSWDKIVKEYIKIFRALP